MALVYQVSGKHHLDWLIPEFARRPDTVPDHEIVSGTNPQETVVFRAFSITAQTRCAVAGISIWRMR